MKQIYIKPEMKITVLTNEDIITTSSGLTNKGEKGKPISESYNSLFY